MEVAIVFFISFILGLSMLFEFGREYLKETTGEAFQPILTSLYSELTLLGFIGLLLFATFKMEWLRELSMEYFGDAEAIQELGEQVHMVLFFVMVVFLMQAFGMARFGERTQRKWHLWETRPPLSSTAAAIEESLETYHQAVRKTTFASHLLARAEDRVREFQHTASRVKFVQEIEEIKLETTDFDFARYLSVALGVQLGELVEVPVKTWFVLELVLLFFWNAEFYCSANARIALWISTGFLTACCAFVVHAKIRLVLHDYTAPLVKEQREQSRGGAETTESSRLVAPPYKDLFWFGDKRFLFDIVRLISLLTSIYMAIFVLCYLDDLVVVAYPADDDSPAARSWRRRGKRSGGAALLVLAFFPPIAVVVKICHVLEDYVVAANISDFKNRRHVEDVLRRQKTVLAFEALKVVQCLRQPEWLDRISRGSADSASSPRTPDSLSNLWSSSSKKRRASYRALEALQREGRDMFETRLRRHWQRIFEVFDRNRRGWIHVDEFRALLSQFANLNPDQFDKVVHRLDADHNDSITFDEFYDFAHHLAAYLEDRRDHRSLVSDMFNMIDVDQSGMINVHEMHNVVARYLGQDLSVDDVLNIIQDIDVDGNGELDEAEFATLLDRLGIFDLAFLR